MGWHTRLVLHLLSRGKASLLGEAFNAGLPPTRAARWSESLLLLPPFGVGHPKAAPGRELSLRERGKLKRALPVTTSDAC